jgi:hypothetical protein
MTDYKSELRQLKAQYKSKRDDYYILMDQVRDNVAQKKVMRNQIVDVQQKVRDEKQTGQ